MAARFKLLSVWSRTPNPVIYAMSKKEDSNERFNLFFGFWPPKPRDKRAPLLPKHSSADQRFKFGKCFLEPSVLLARAPEPHDETQFFSRSLPGF